MRTTRGCGSQRLLGLVAGEDAIQPYVARLESGRVENLGLHTLVKCALALGASLRIELLSAAAAPARPARASAGA